MKIEEILKDLDWSLPQNIQEEGIERAKMSENLFLFLQPCSEKFNKNVWNNCARVLESKTDDELLPYLIPLLEWFEDLNWPGVDIIWNRLKMMDKSLLMNPVLYSLSKAIWLNNENWKNNLIKFSKDIDIYKNVFNYFNEI